MARRDFYFRTNTIGRAFAAMVFSWLLPGILSAEEQILPITARDIVKATGVKGGLVVLLPFGDGRLAADFVKAGPYLVHGLNRSKEEVEKARENLKSWGIYGKASVELWQKNYLPYAEEIVNLAVTLSPVRDAESMGEWLRVLAPGGVLCISANGKLRTIRREFSGVRDEWTHALHGPDNNAVAKDKLVGPPRHIKWVGSPKWARSHDHLASVSVVVSAGGRIFYIVDEGATAFVALPSEWRLVARDAFSGVVLWKRKIHGWENHLRGFRSGPASLGRRLVATSDNVFVTLGYDEPVSALDAATGKTLRVYSGTEGTEEILHEKGILYLVAGERDKENPVKGLWWRYATPSVHKKRIMALDAETGRLLWQKHDEETEEVFPLTLCVSGGRVFFQNPQAVLCLDAKTGRRIWRAERPSSTVRLGWSTPTLVAVNGVVLSADRGKSASLARSLKPEKGKVLWIPSSAGGIAPPGELIAYSVENGEELWRCPCREGYNSPVDVLVVRGVVWTGNLVRATDPGMTEGRDLRTGRIVKRRPPDSSFFRIGMGHHRCYRNKATENYLILNRAGIELVDVRTGAAAANHWVRGTCQYGVMPSYGLLYAPPHSCACYIQAKLNGFNALSSSRRTPVVASQKESRLLRGPAYGTIDLSKDIDRAGWPTYRHDISRSGSTSAEIPKALQLAWSKPIGGRLTALTAGKGKIFFAQVDTHTVFALRESDGSVAWTFTAEGRVDSPPTLCGNGVFFGSRDGYVYCVRASDGVLAWRFRAAPEERRIFAYGQLESVWPVHGSVLILNGELWCAAGRCSFTDGGIRLWRLEAATGKVLSITRINSLDPRTGLEPEESVRGVDMTGALPDILSSDGRSVFMRHKRFDLEGNEKPPEVPHLFSSIGFLDGSWWHRSYWFYGTGMRCGYGGWPAAGNRNPAGRILVLSKDTAYGFGRSRYVHYGSHVGVDAYTIFHYRMRRNGGPRWIYYLLFAEKIGPGKAKGPKRGREYVWSRGIPFLVRAMVLAGDTLAVAGPPSVWPGPEGTEMLEGKRGGLLLLLSASEGKELFQLDLPSPPEFDGMIAAGGRIYLSAEDGKVYCYKQRAARNTKKTRVKKGKKR